LKKIIKKRKLIILAIAIVNICFCVIFFWRLNIKKSILGEIKIKQVSDMEQVRLAQEDFFAQKHLSKRDKYRLFQILSSTREYNKKKDEDYLLDGSFLYSPKVYFDFDNETYRISWEYKTGIMYCDSIGENRKTYYLKKENALKLKKLYEKYIDLRGVSHQ
jgi:hypothetical protein